MSLTTLASRTPLAVALALSLSGCWETHHHGHHHSSPHYDLWELEPNDSHCCPDTIGTLYVGDQFVIGGTIRDDGYDPFDGFAFTSASPMDITFRLEPVGSQADLDLGVWDPVVGDFVLLYDSPYATETGQFTLPAGAVDFHLVVMSYVGDSEYRLTIWVDPATFSLVAPRAAVPSKSGRPFDVHLYGPKAAEPEADLAAPILDRGIALEVDPASGEVLVRDLVLSREGLFLGAARR